MESSAIFQGIWILLAVLEAGLYFQLILGTVIEKKLMSRIDTALMWAGNVAFSALLVEKQKFMFFSRLTFLTVLAVIIVCTCLIWRKEFMMLIAVGCSYYSFMALLDSFFIFLQAAFVKSEVNAVIFATEISVEKMMLCACIISRISMLFLVQKICKTNIKKQKEEFCSILLVISGVLLFLVLVYQSILEHSVTYATFVSVGVEKSNVRNSMIAFLTSVVIAGMMAVLLLKNRSIEKENGFLLMKEEMERQKYEELTTALEKNRELVHDTKNHYLIISEYERTGEYEKLHQYIEALKNDFIRINPEIYTGNRILDLILGQKRMKAEQKGIDFELQAMPLGKLPFHDREICSLFGNLLDNALEACGSAGGKKKILIKLEKQKNLFFAEIANTMREVPLKDGKRFLTSKHDKENHGYGLKSVQRIVDEYEGVISYEAKENEFIVTLSFFDIG